MEQNIIQRKSESNKYNFTNVIQDENKKSGMDLSDLTQM